MVTPFQEILHTNAVPSDAECQRIRELLVGPRREAAELSDEIERLQGLIHHLTEKRAHLNDFIDAHAALISPVRRLPEDVVAEIFAASLPSDRNAIMSGAKSPLLLCHVCKAWRNLALLTPFLWTSLHIVAPTDPSRVQQLDEAAESWLSRSGVLPLSISLVGPGKTPAKWDCSVLLGTLIRYASRWKKLRIKFNSHRGFKPLAVLTLFDVPILETIVIEGFLPERRHPVDWDAVSFLRTTSLRRVALVGVHGFFPFLLPWNRLRHLFLGQENASWLTAAEALDMLRQSPNLEKCSLPLMAHAGNGPLPLACRMEHLRQLSIVDMSGANVFFENLDTPNLQTLEYMAQNFYMSPFTPWLASARHLQCLGLHVANIIELRADTIIELLRVVPALRELIICHDSFYSPAIDANELWTSLTPTARNFDAVLCPKLRVLKLFHSHHTSDNMLLAFIQARTGFHFPNIAQLSKIHVHFVRPMYVDIVSALQPAIADGLDITLRYTDLPQRSRHRRKM
ncbi:hypothetical protein B0H13DRAFT_1721179 [Mycena leptocephala]|nr:hypothetical protein B0H13DRAFT_1721179 [Mycena leptocephala]